MTKLHILLITTLLGVGLYMFLIYKEIRLFEREVADLRIKVQSFAASLPHPATVDIVSPAAPAAPSACPFSGNSAPAASHVVEEVPVIAHNGENENVSQDIDDNASVTSNEIKEILTNIQDINEDELIEEAKQSQAAASSAPPSTSPSLSNDQVEVDVEEISSTTVPRSTKINPKIASLKLAELTDEEIRGISYDNLRAILRNHGVANPRGTKGELVNKAIEVKINRKVLNFE